MKHLNYQKQDTKLTLKEGLNEYLNHIGPEAKLTGDTKNEFDKDYYQFLLGHDCQHVIFGLALSLEEESILDTWALKGTSGIPWRATLKYAFSGGELSQLYKKMYQKHGLLKILILPLKARNKKAIVKKRVKLMKKKWPWNVPEEYFDRSIKSLREEYNIFVLDKKELHFDNPTYI